MVTTRGRLVQINQVIVDQADFFGIDGFTRVQGLTLADVSLKLFYDNKVQPWPLIDGTNLADAQVRSGSVYWSEVDPGYYGVRMRPNAVGYWRLLITYTAGTQIMAQDYDVTAQPPFIESGLKVSFTKS